MLNKRDTYRYCIQRYWDKVTGHVRTDVGGGEHISNTALDPKTSLTTKHKHNERIRISQKTHMFIAVTSSIPFSVF